MSQIISEGRKRARWLLGSLVGLGVLACLATGAGITYGAINGGQYYSAGALTNAALFSGKGVAAAEGTVVRDIEGCGRRLHLFSSIAYQTAPFTVQDVTVSRGFTPAAGAALRDCVQSALAPMGASAQICSAEAASSTGLNLAGEIAPYAANVVICTTEVGS